MPSPPKKKKQAEEPYGVWPVDSSMERGKGAEQGGRCSLLQGVLQASPGTHGAVGARVYLCCLPEGYHHSHRPV